MEQAKSLIVKKICLVMRLESFKWMKNHIDYEKSKSLLKTWIKSYLILLKYLSGDMHVLNVFNRNKWHVPMSVASFKSFSAYKFKRSHLVDFWVKSDDTNWCSDTQLQLIDVKSK